jgi:pimeloyl-ACP methyl ester carboxylesterase
MLKLFGRDLRLSAAAAAALAIVAVPAFLVGARDGASAAAGGQESGNAARWPCFVEGVGARAECHRIEVPEDWTKPDGRKVALHVAVLPAAAPSKDGSALFILAGGPGQAATHYGDLISREFERVRASRPIILMDQRGTGASNGLRCAFEGGNPLDADQEASDQELQACKAKWGGTALQNYTTLDTVRDMDAVRARLGFEKLDLWGASWGTRTALLYMRAHPERVRSAVIDGVTGPNQALFLEEARYAQAAFNRLFDDCEKDGACNTAFPGLRQRAMQRLSQEAPAPMTYVATDGKPVTATMPQDMLRQVVRGALYAPESAALLPYALDRLIGGDGSPIMALAGSAIGMNRETMFHGALFSSLCAEELPRAPAAQAQQAGAGTFARETFYKGFAKGCQGWPVKPLPANYAAPVTANVPVLLLSGALDPVTPPASAQKVAQHLPRAWHIVVPASGHNVSAMPCAGRVLAEFYKAADGAALDATCLTRRKRPPFMVSPFGPKA